MTPVGGMRDVPVELLVAAVAALVALFGYLLNQQAARRERKATTFAEAIAAVTEYEELPYLIRRRAASDPASRASLAERISGAQIKLSFHTTWLETESSKVAAKYRTLVRAAREEAGRHMRAAWLEPIIDSDDGMNLTQAYPRDGADAGRKECIAEMDGHLAAWWRWPVAVLIVGLISVGMVTWWSTGR